MVIRAPSLADAPTRRPSAARDRILATASRLFYGTGIRAVGVDRVIAESKVARMTFFRHFPTKDHLVLAFLETQADLGRTELLALAEQDGPRAVLAAVLAGVSTESSREGFRGCEFVNTAAEFSDADHPARLVVAGHRRWIRDLMRDVLGQLGHPSPAATAEVLLTLRTGAIVACSLEGFVDDSGALERTWWRLVDRPDDVGL